MTGLKFLQTAHSDHSDQFAQTIQTNVWN